MATTNTLLLVNERKLRDLFPSNPPTGHLEASGVLAMDGLGTVFVPRDRTAFRADQVGRRRVRRRFGSFLRVAFWIVRRRSRRSRRRRSERFSCQELALASRKI